jgi:DNA-directed RNA polymerase subunit RPC12/RpoP
MSDHPTIELAAPLPGDAMSARLTWRARRGGLRPGSVDVARSEATHASLETVDLGGRTHERELSLDEAEAWLSDALALQERAAAIDARARHTREAAAAEAAQVTATLDLRCPRCGVPRVYAGRRDVQVTDVPADGLLREDRLDGRTQLVGYHEYGCPRCGSVELFGAGPLRHPLEHRADGR